MDEGRPSEVVGDAAQESSEIREESRTLPEPPQGDLVRARGRATSVRPGSLMKLVRPEIVRRLYQRSTEVLISVALAKPST